MALLPSNHYILFVIFFHNIPWALLDMVIDFFVYAQELSYEVLYFGQLRVSTLTTAHWEKIQAETALIYGYKHKYLEVTLTMTT